MRRGKDCFNIIEPLIYGPFSHDLENDNSFFVNDKYSGMYPSEILDIKLGNQAPNFSMLVRRLC